MSDLSPKKAAARAYLEAVGKGDADALRAVVTDDYMHEFLGTTVFATHKRNVAEITEMLVGLKANLVSDGTFIFHEMVEEGDIVISIFSGRMELVSGKRYDGIYGAAFHFRGDKIFAIRELMDTKLADSVMA